MIAPWLVYASAMGIVIGVVALLLEQIARWRRSPTRWIWLVALVVIVALPAVLNVVAPAPVPTPVPPSAAGGVPSAVAIRRVQHSRVNIDEILIALWLLASATLSLRIVVGALALRRRRKSWVAANLDGADVLLADELGPAVIGWRRFSTVIPRWALSFDEASRGLMLHHESEHMRAGDPYLRTAAIVATVAMPWNPAVWWAMRRLRLAVEMDCDQRVLARGVDPREYASLLLAVGERMSATPFAWATALGGSRSSLERRIVAMTAPFRPRHPRVAVAAIGICCAAMIAIACASPVPDPLLRSVAAPTPGARYITSALPAGANPAEFVVDTLEYWCQDSPEARADTSCSGRHFYIEYRRRSPRDTVEVPYTGSIPRSIELESVCAVDADCHGYVADGRRGDTLFMFRTNPKAFDDKVPTHFRADSAGTGFDVEGYRVYRGKEDASTASDVLQAVDVLRDRIARTPKCPVTAISPAGRPVTVSDSDRLVCMD